MSRRFKGQQDVLSTIIISGILIGVVGSVYLWGVPLIQKNQDISTLRTAEDFMSELNEKIKFVANNGGKDRMQITMPGILEIRDNRIELRIDTQGTIYATEAEIPLGTNECSREEGVWGQHDSSVFCVKSHKQGESSFKTTYSLQYIRLEVSAVRTFAIEIVGSTIGGQDRVVVIENLGTTEGAITATKVGIEIP